MLAAAMLAKAHQSVHQGQLARVVEFEAGNAFSGGQNRGFGKLSKLAAIDESFENVLLHIEVVVVDGCHLLAELGKIFDRFSDALIGDIGGCLGAQIELLDEPVAIMAADDGIGQIEIPVTVWSLPP